MNQQKRLLCLFLTVFLFGINSLFAADPQISQCSSQLRKIANEKHQKSVATFVASLPFFGMLTTFSSDYREQAMSFKSLAQLIEASYIHTEPEVLKRRYKIKDTTQGNFVERLSKKLEHSYNVSKDKGRDKKYKKILNDYYSSYKSVMKRFHKHEEILSVHDYAQKIMQLDLDGFFCGPKNKVHQEVKDKTRYSNLVGLNIVNAYIIDFSTPFKDDEADGELSFDEISCNPEIEGYHYSDFEDVVI